MTRASFTFLVSLLLAFSCVEVTHPLVIDCWFGEASYWSVLEKPYACIDYNIRGAENVKETITGVTGSIRDGLSYSDVKVIDLRGFCSFIPSGFDKYFNNIEGFSAYNTSMLTVTSDDLKQFPKLKELWIYFNLLEFLPSNLFEHNPDIEFIHFNANKIKYVAPDLFTKIPKLHGAKFGSNKCIDRNVADIKKLQLLKREIKKKCSLETGPSEIDQDITSLQISYLQLEVARLEMQLKKLKDMNKNKCDVL